ATMKPGSDCVERIQKASLPTVAAGGGNVCQTDRAGVREQDVNRTGGRNFESETGHVLIGHVVRQPVGLGPDAADRCEAQTLDLSPSALTQQHGRAVPVARPSE